jgi:hypothetical protein
MNEKEAGSACVSHAVFGVPPNGSSPNTVRAGRQPAPQWAKDLLWKAVGCGAGRPAQQPDPPPRCCGAIKRLRSPHIRRTASQSVAVIFGGTGLWPVPAGLWPGGREWIFAARSRKNRNENEGDLTSGFSGSFWPKLSCFQAFCAILIQHVNYEHLTH